MAWKGRGVVWHGLLGAVACVAKAWHERGVHRWGMGGAGVQHEGACQACCVGVAWWGRGIGVAAWAWRVRRGVVRKGRGVGGRGRGVACTGGEMRVARAWLHGRGRGVHGRGMGVTGAWRGWPTFFLSSTLMALASLRKMALPHSRSRSDVNWYHFHFRKAHSASSHSRSVHWTVRRGGPSRCGAGAQAPRVAPTL